jgi:hypothetical protein
VKKVLDFVGMSLYIPAHNIKRKEARSMPETRHCMLCGASDRVEQKKKGVEIWLCDWCIELEWWQLLSLLARKRQERLLNDIARGVFELGVAVDALMKEPRKPRVHYKIPGCKAHV